MANKKISQLTNSLTKATIATNDIVPVVDTSASETKKMTYQELIQPTDANFRIAGSADNTKLLAFEVDGFTTATTRTVTIPDANTTMVGTDTTQTLTNKTLTSPVLNLTSDATGDMYYRNSSGALTRLPIGSAGQIIQVSSSGIPEYIANPSAADASTTVKGVVELATQAEVNAGTSTGGTGAKLVVTPDTLSTWLGTQSIPAFSATAGENISANKPAYIEKEDGLIYTAHGFKQTSAATTFTQPTTITTYQIAKLNSTQFMTLHDNGANTLTISVYNKATPTSAVATATVSTTFSGTGLTLTTATVSRLTDSTFVVFYTNTTNSSLRFRTGSISGSTITMDTDTAYPGGPTYCYGVYAVPADADGKVVLAYGDDTVANGSSGTMSPTLSYLTVATNSVTVTYTTSYSITSGAYFAQMYWSISAFSNGIAYGMYCVHDAGGVGEVAYNFINVKTGEVGANYKTTGLETFTGAGITSAYGDIMPNLVGHNGCAYFGYTTGKSQSIIKLSQSGSKLLYQNTPSGSTTFTTAALKMAGSNAGIIVFNMHTSDYLGQYLYIQKDNIYGLFGTALSSYPIRAHDSWYKNSKDEIVFHDGNGTTLYTWSLPTPVDGFVTTAASISTSAIIFSGVVTSSGLTANSPYFLKDTYTTVGDLASTGTIPVGQSLSSTTIIFGN